MRRTLACIVSDIVAKNKRKQFTARELAEIIVKTEHDFVIKKIERTLKTDKELVWQLMSEIGAQSLKFQRYNIGKNTQRPQKYFYQKAATDRVQEAIKAHQLAKKQEASKAKTAAKAK